MKTLKWAKRSNSYQLDTGRCIWDWIDEAPDYNSGTIESINAKIERIMDVLQQFANIMTEEQQRNLMDCVYGYDEVKEKK